MPKRRDFRNRKNIEVKSNVIPFRRKRNYKNVLLMTFLFILILIIVLFSPIFNIQAIEVIGNDRFTDEQIINLSGIPLGQNIFKVNYFKSKDNILKNQYIESVKISRSYPNKVKIKVEERKPAAYFKYIGLYLIIDKNGIVLDVLDSLKGMKIPVIEGIKFKDYKLGEILKVNDQDIEKFNIAKKCINASIENNINEVISKIDVSNVNNLMAWAYGDKFQIKLIDDNEIPYKFKFLAKILEQEKERESKCIIDFTTVSKPYISLDRY